MIWFKRTNNVPSLHLKTLEARIIGLEAEVLALATSLNIIRNKVLRKIQFKQEEEPREDTTFTYSNQLLKDDFMGVRR